MAAKQKGRRIAVPEIAIPDKGISSPPPSPGASPGPASSTKPSGQRTNCLCSPTTHVGSFRCRHHRGTAPIRSSVSVGSALSEYAGGRGSLPPRHSSGLPKRGSSRSFGDGLSELTDETAAGVTPPVGA